MLVEKPFITKYIPQRQPMVMVDGLLSSDEKSTASIFQPDSHNLFCKEGLFTEPGLIENMAQTAALRAGYEAKQKKESVKVGFIGAVKNLKIYRLPFEAEILTTKIEIKNNFGNATIVKGQVFVKGKIVAQAELSIFTREEQTV
jgi:3-hydroxymyristoyl/3-hydroxydecanoyl-(acyl carrier protein) dehydratase